MILLMMALACQDWQAIQSEDLRIVDRLKAIESRLDESVRLWPALEVIRKELADSRKEREEMRGLIERFDLTPLRDAMGEFIEKSARDRDGILKAVTEGRSGLLSEILASREDIAGRLAPIAGLVELVKENALEIRGVKSGLLSGLAEVRAEVIRAKAELAEANAKLTEARAQLIEIQGTLGQRFFWFAVYLVGGCAVLLIGGTLLAAFVYAKLSKLINSIPLPKVV